MIQNNESVMLAIAPRTFTAIDLNGDEKVSLSEGEKKLLLVYGAINLLSGENLYLLDEPDAHLHEGRKREMFG